MRVGNFGGFKYGVCKIDCQTAKFNSPPNFPAIHVRYYYINMIRYRSVVGVRHSEPLSSIILLGSSLILWALV